MLRAVAIVISLLLVGACAEPPSKEMHQAQGAIDAATAAGAGDYAADELKSAVDALAQADVAVGARDYRLALGLALDSRERAQNAAKSAVDARAKARGDAERGLAEAAALVDRAEAELKQPEALKRSRRAIAAIGESVVHARTTLQEARAALEREEYERVREMSNALSVTFKAAIAELNAAPPPPARPRKR